MTNEELKKRIMGILDQATGDWYEKDDGLFAEGYTPEEGDNRFKVFIADALIAAGIGDVKEAEMAANRYEMLYKLQNRDMALAERRAHDVEHRAARAERALKIAEELGELCAPAKDYIQQAERELAEEGKE